MRWKVAEAKQRFSELLRAAAEEPQLIFNRDRLIAAVIDRQSLRAFQAWQADQQRSSLADAFAEARRICQEEAYTLEAPPRRDRANAFAKAIADAV